jgi:hypothetical protein
MAIALYAEMLEQLEHRMLLNHESQNYTSDTGCEILMTGTVTGYLYNVGSQVCQTISIWFRRCLKPKTFIFFSYSLNELVKHDVNGWTFDSATQLSDQLQTWFRGFPQNKSQQERETRFRKELEYFQKLRWHENWTFSALPLFTVH